MTEDPLLLGKFAIVIAQLAGALSLAASVCTGMEAFSDWKEESSHSRRHKPSIVTRIQAVLQVPLGVFSFLRMLGLLPAPSSVAWSGLGNDGTCTAQGAIILFTLMSAIPLDMCLSLCFLLMIKYGWTEYRLRGLETYFYVVTIPFSLFVSGYALLYGMFGPQGPTCFLEVPRTCENDVTSADFPFEDNSTCTPTPPQLVGVRFIVFGVNMAHMCFSFYAMARIYFVARLEWNKAEEAVAGEEADEYARGMQSTNTAMTVEHVVSNLVMWKGFLYAACIGVIQLPLAIWALLVLSGYSGDLRGLDFLATVMVPFSGFFNMLVFFLGRRRTRTAYGKWVRTLLDAAAEFFTKPFKRCGPSSSNEMDGEDDVEEDKRPEWIEIGKQDLSSTSTSRNREADGIDNNQR